MRRSLGPRLMERAAEVVECALVLAAGGNAACLSCRGAVRTGRSRQSHDPARAGPTDGGGDHDLRRRPRLAGAFIIDLERREDDRGFFARTFCQNEFADHGLKPTIAQANLAFNADKGTLRGMHFQYPPAAETKLVRCTRGAILDIIVDLRPESPTYLQHIAVELTADNHRALYVPERFAHGYQVLEDAHRDELPGRRVLHARRTRAGCATTIPASGSTWPLPVDRDVAEGRRLAAARRGRGRARSERMSVVSRGRRRQEEQP